MHRVFAGSARTITGILLATAVLAGCGAAFTRDAAVTEFETAGLMTGSADNCTKCHVRWAARFNYYHGWDRYGMVFDDVPFAGAYDPWLDPAIDNLDRRYYATGWWQSDDLYPWPDNIADQVSGMGVLARAEGLPSIPNSPGDITGPVITVGTHAGDERTIGDAVRRARAGTTVFVRPGEYEETVVLKDGVSLIGEDPATTIINPQNAGHAVRAANRSMIAGFTITGTGIDYETGAFNSAIYAEGVDSTCVIAGNIIRNNGLFGVWVTATPDDRATRDLERTNTTYQMEFIDRPYLDEPNPVIMGNTFYRIGQRAVFCVHSSPEVYNNIFTGNVKAVGLDQHSRAFIHHNVFYYNNVPMAVNRSEPVICNNVFERNQWGQRMMRGANPVIFGNVSHNSPFFRDFDESGLPIPYQPLPGTGKLRTDPMFADPLAGDFRFREDSPLAGRTRGFDAVGIMRDAGIPQPPGIEAADSFGREVLALTDDVVELIEVLDTEQHKVRQLRAGYRIDYTGYQDVTLDDGVVTESRVSNVPVVTDGYVVSDFRLDGGVRETQYQERITRNGETQVDEGTVRLAGTDLDATGGRFAALYAGTPDSRFIGDRPFREAPGGYYRDYDQYINGAAGPTGTYLIGFLRIMGGLIEEERKAVDGHDCVVVRYPHIGTDQYYEFWLDPAIGWRPRKIVQYVNTLPYEVVDGYEYADCGEGIRLPVRVRVTDYAVRGDSIGNPVAVWTLAVEHLVVNGRTIR